MGSSISSYSWTYDVEGRAASFTAPEGTFAYGYDHKDQLTSATFTVASGYTGGTPASESFNFDDTGNRTGGGNSVTKNRLMRGLSRGRSVEEMPALRETWSVQTNELRSTFGFPVAERQGDFELNR